MSLLCGCISLNLSMNNGVVCFDLEIYSAALLDQHQSIINQFIEVGSDSSLASIGLKHGDMLFLKEKAVEKKDPPAFLQKDYQKDQSSLRERQKRSVPAEGLDRYHLLKFHFQDFQPILSSFCRCNHGPRGRCLNCDNVKSDVLKGRQGQFTPLAV